MLEHFVQKHGKMMRIAPPQGRPAVGGRGGGRAMLGPTVRNDNPSVTGASATDTSPFRGGKAVRCVGAAISRPPVRLLCRGRRPRRPVCRTRTHVGGRFTNRPYGDAGWQSAASTSGQRARDGRAMLGPTVRNDKGENAGLRLNSEFRIPNSEFSYSSMACWPM